jgi:Ala-tRNA(Pro) deacylase
MASQVKVDSSPGCGRDVLFHTLRELGIRTVAYKPIGEREGMAGIFCKNLLLKDRKGQFYYVLCREDLRLDLKRLKFLLGAQRNFSFAADMDLVSLLHTVPGAVTPFSFVFPSARNIRFVMDSYLQRYEDTDICLNFHPLTPELTTLITYSNLLLFLNDCQVNVEFVEL